MASTTYPKRPTIQVAHLTLKHILDAHGQPARIPHAGRAEGCTAGDPAVGSCGCQFPKTL